MMHARPKRLSFASASSILMMTIFTLLLSPIFNYIKLKAQSVIATAVLHRTLNASGGLALLVIKEGNDLTVALTRLAGFIATLIMNILLFSYDRFLAKQSIYSHTIKHELA